VETEALGLVVEDLAAVRRGLRSVLATVLDARVDEAQDVQSASRLLSRATHYRIVLVDLGLPDGSGLELIHALRRSHSSTLVVVTTIFDDDENVFGALAAGADGYLLKEHPPEQLVEHLRGLERGVPALSPAVARRILAHFRAASAPETVASAVAPSGTLGSRAEPNPSPFGADPITSTFRTIEDRRLSPRETEVLSLVGRGLARGDVADVLAISENTVAKYLKEIYRKLRISSRAEAALEARRRGLV
jgi:DNA-binding NarL/FixJ family response regulator